MDSRDARGAVRRTHAEEELMKTPVVLITGALYVLAVPRRSFGANRDKPPR